MDGHRSKSRLAPAMVTTAMLSAILGMYAAGYLLLSDNESDTRLFKSAWLCRFYTPAAQVEAKVRGRTIGLACRDPGKSVHYQRYFAP